MIILFIHCQILLTAASYDDGPFFNATVVNYTNRLQIRHGIVFKKCRMYHIPNLMRVYIRTYNVYLMCLLFYDSDRITDVIRQNPVAMRRVSFAKRTRQTYVATWVCPKAKFNKASLCEHVNMQLRCMFIFDTCVHHTLATRQTCDKIASVDFA